MESLKLPLTVFFDGQCVVCASEMAHYRRRGLDQNLRFVDISDPLFSAEEHGRSYEEFMAQMHVRAADGLFYTGVDAFTALWRAMPSTIYHDLARIVRLPGIHLLATLGYHGFARIRRFLPKYKNRCEHGTCGMD